MMRIAAMEAAKRFVNARFPNCDTAFLAGSATRGEETASSDLDILIFDAATVDFRESFEEYGWRIECFVNNHDSYLSHFEMDREKGRPVLAAMIAEGIILKDNGLARTLKEDAAGFIQQGPGALTEEFIYASRYFLFDLLDDFIDSKNREEETVTLSTLSVQLIDFILRFHGQWSGRGKMLARAFDQFDPERSQKFFAAMHQYYVEGDKQPIVDFVHEVYEPLGGQLFAGFSMGKKSGRKDS